MAAGSLSFTSKFKKKDELILSPQELLNTYFYGIQITESQGTSMSSEVIKRFIQAAQEEVEKWLGIKIAKQIITEDKDFHRNDWYSWGYIRTTYPCSKGLSLDGYIGEVKQIQYPTEWLSVRHTSDGELYHRHLYLVPSTNSPSPSMVVYTGMTPHLSLTGSITVPNYWRISYETGFCKVPKDLLNFIGMLAAINIFHIMGDIILGAPGVSSQSIGIDGLSQSYSAKSDGYGGRIKGYLEMMNGTNGRDGLKERVYNYYKGFTVSSF